MTFNGRKFSIGVSCSLNDDADKTDGFEALCVAPLVAISGVSSGKLGIADIMTMVDDANAESRRETRSSKMCLQAELYTSCTNNGSKRSVTPCPTQGVQA